MKAITFLLISLLIVSCTKIEPVKNNKLGIIFSYDGSKEEDNMLNLLDMAWVFVQEINVSSPEEAINVTKSYNGVCRHYSTILYELLHNKLNRSEVYLVVGSMYFINGSDIHGWDNELESGGKTVNAEDITNHQWVYDAELGILDLMEDNFDEESIPVRIPVLVINDWSEWGWKTDLINCNLKKLYEYELGIFEEKTGFPEITKEELQELVISTEEWYEDRTYNSNYWVDKKNC